MITYKAKNLADIAEVFKMRARKAEDEADRQPTIQRRKLYNEAARTWSEAAEIINATELVVELK